MIEFIGVSKEYRTPHRSESVKALKDFTLKVPEGKTTCLVGRSGCGKTTAIRLINRLAEPTAGEIRVGGKNVRDLDIVKLRRRIGYVVQNGGLFPHLTIENNLRLLAQLEGMSAESTTVRIKTLLELVRLSSKEYLKKYPCELSGGQRQRVCVARSLVLDPDYVLMDEPFSALDPLTRSQIQDEFIQIKSQFNKTVVIVTHDIPEAFKLGDEVAVLDQGQLLQVGNSEELTQNPRNSYVKEFLAEQMEAANL